MATFESAEIVQSSEGRQYHIGLKADQVAPFCILVGDPARAEKVAGHFDIVTEQASNREYVTLTGTYKSIPITVMGTGIGCDNVEIAIIEYTQLIENPTFIRVGSCGAVRKGIELGDLVITSGAVRLESTTSYFVPDGYSAVSNHEVVLALIEGAHELGTTHHVGLTATAAGFYGAQSRTVPGYTPRFPDLPEEMERIGVLNFEMEASAVLTYAALKGLRAGCVCAVYANRHQNKFIDTDTKDLAEARAIECGLAAVRNLHKMDQARGDAPHWRPSMGF